jgi:hypothetical protein
MRRVAAESAENPSFSADDPALKSFLFNAYISSAICGLAAVGKSKQINKKGERNAGT